MNDDLPTPDASTVPDAVTTPSPRALERPAADGTPDRAWLPLGTVDDGVVAHVDPAGMVQLVGRTWSLDWWVGAEDRWHHPSREVPVRQQLLGDAPVVETAMRVPGGDVVHRVLGVRADDSGWSGAAVVVEVENLSSVPVALGLAVRPVVLDGPGRAGEAAVDGPVLSVDGAPVAVVSRAAARAVVGADEVLAERLAHGDDDPPEAQFLGMRAGAVSVVPLPHTSVVRVLLPVSPQATREAGPTAGWAAPTAAQVEKGWRVHTDDAVRVGLPEPTASPIVTRTQRLLLVGTTSAASTLLDRHAPRPAGPSGAARMLSLVDALSRSGLSDPVGPIARGLAEAQRLTGPVKLADGSDASAALVAAGAVLLSGPRAEVWMDELVGPVAKAVDRLAKGKGLDGLDRAHVATALASAAAAFRCVDQPDVAAFADQTAARLDPGYDGPTNGRVLTVLTADSLGADPVVGWDGAALAAGFVTLLDGLVVWTPDGLRLCDGWATSWAGQDVEVHGVRTPWGTAGFALRWHETRPALLWEVEPGPGADPDRPPVVTATRMDPDWSGAGWEGEALLAAPKGAGPATGATDLPVPGEGESFS